MPSLLPKPPVLYHKSYWQSSGWTVLFYIGISALFFPLSTKFCPL